MSASAQTVPVSQESTTLSALAPVSLEDRIATLETLMLSLWSRVEELEACAAETTPRVEEPDELQAALLLARQRRKSRS